MKILYTILLFSMMSISIFAQTSKQEAISIEKEIIANAKLIGDSNVATYSMYKLIALEGKNSTYKDSLAFIYYSSRKYGSCFMMAKQVLERDPKNEQMLEIKANSLESLGARDKAMESYAELFALTNNNYNGYNLARLQLSMNQFDEAYTTIKKVEAINDTGKVQVNYNINQNHTQKIELIAAIQYLKGLIEEQLSKMDEAKISFGKALKIQPEFVLAKEKLDKLGQ